MVKGERKGEEKGEREKPGELEAKQRDFTRNYRGSIHQLQGRGDNG